MTSKFLTKLICKFPPKIKRYLLLKIEGDNTWLHGGGAIGSALNDAIDRFVPKELQQDKKYMNKVISDIKKCFIKYDLLPAEYFYFEFENKNEKTRSEYLTDSLEDEILIRVTGYDKYLNDLSNKWHFYELAKPFFRREVLLFEECIQKSKFIDFAVGVKDLFIKPLTGSEGEGAFTSSIKSKEDAVHLYEKLVATKAKWMVEERIKQSAEMSAWNESSINTVRVPAFLNKIGFNVLGTVFRTGRNNTCVDNIAAGGLFALVDEKTGIIKSNGLDVKWGEYETHPETGMIYKGWQIPRWSELLETAETVHRSFPSHIYIAWDFALTEKGWVLIEGNWGRLRSVQIAEKRGIKKEFSEFMSGKSLIE